jgi:RNA polymerase sigma factor (sigma-70 family)
MPVTELNLISMSDAQSNVAAQREPTSDALLLVRYFKHGSRDAMDELFNRHTNTAYRLALAEIGNAADAEEAVQAAFLQILLKGGKAKIGNVRGWIMRIVIDTCRDKLKEEIRRRKRQETAAQSQDQSAASASATDSEKAELVSAAISAIKGLPTKYRLPVWLHHLEGLSFKEVGYALSLPEDTVAQQSSRGLEQVRQSLAALGFTASAAAIPALLTSSSLPGAPAALTASLKNLIANAAEQGARAGTAVPNALALKTKAAFAGAVLLVVIAAALVQYHGGRKNEAKQDGDETSAAASPALPPNEEIGKLQAPILEKKVDAAYRRDSLSEVLNDLDRHASLRSAFSRAIDKSFLFTLEEKQVTVRQLLEKLAKEGKLDLECHGDEVVFWKKADDKTIAELDRKLLDGDEEARCEAIYDLALLGDKRIYPLLSRALSDKQAIVAAKAIVELNAGHRSTWHFVGSAQENFATVSKLFSSPDLAGYKLDLVGLLGATRDPRAIDQLIVLLKDPDPRVRIGAAEALAETRDPRAVEALIAFLKGADSGLRERAASALANTRDPRAVEPLIALSHDADANLRSSAAAALCKMADPRAVDAFIALLKDEDPNVPGNASFSLFGTHDLEAVAPFITLLEEAQARRVISSADDLRIRRNAKAIDGLIALAKTDNPGVQANAAYCLGMTRDGRALDALIALSKDANPFLRFIAGSPMGDTRDPRATERLLTLLRDDDPNVRQNAANGLGEVCDPGAVDPLLALLKDPNANFRAAAARALGQIRNTRAMEPLPALLSDTDANVRASIADALGQTRNPRGIKPLLTLLKDENRIGRSVAAFALGKIRDRRTVDTLLPLLSDVEQGVRAAAAFALGKIGDPRAVEGLLALLKDPSPNVRTKTVDALRTWESGNASVQATLAEYEKHEAAKARPPTPPSSDF